MKLLFTLVVYCVVYHAQAQQTELASDQNPNYKVSQLRYMAQKDSLSQYMNTTNQQTYEAFDWLEAKQERRQNRINNRQQVRLLRNMNGGYWDNNWGFNGFNNFSGWNNGWNNNNWGNPFNNRFSIFPSSIGLRSGNWCFWW